MVMVCVGVADIVLTEEIVGVGVPVGDEDVVGLGDTDVAGEGDADIVGLGDAEVVGLEEVEVPEESDMTEMVL